MSIITMTTFGELIKELRRKKKISQKHVAACLNIDASLLAKYENNVRYPPNDLILKISDFYNIASKDLILEVLTDKIAHQILDENMDSNALKLAENKVKYIKSQKNEL